MTRRTGHVISTILLLIAVALPYQLFASSEREEREEHSTTATKSHRHGKTTKEQTFQSVVFGRYTPGQSTSQDSPAAQLARPVTPKVLRNAKEYRLKRARSFNGDLRTLPQVRPERFERPEREEPDPAPAMYPGAAPRQAEASSVAPAGRQSPAPATTVNFDGLDFANWGAGHPPDTNGDVGPNYYIQTINTSIGIYQKSDGSRVAAFTFNTFMSQGHFGNLCDTNNFGDPVVLYDTFEDRWVISDFAFGLDGSGNISPQHAYQCFAASKTGDPVAGGWNYYSIEVVGGLGDYPKFGIWPDGIYMSANVFGYAAGASFQNARVFAFNKAQMYAGAPTVQMQTFDAPVGDFALLPSNARLQTGTPAPGTPNYFVSTWEFLNAVTVYKFHVDWNRPTLSTFSGPDIPLAATSWPNASVANAPSLGGNSLDTLQIRAMMQNQYSNIGGVESLWFAHTVRRANTTGFAAPRWYQVDVTGGTVAANIPQASTWDPDGANVMHRFMPSVAVDRAGNMAIGYSSSSATTKPAINYAGRLAGDPANTLTQTEQLLIQGAGTQTGNCGSSACTRWGDYSAMTLDQDGCTFWYTNMYYAVDGLNHQTRVGAFSYPSCTPVAAAGTISGVVTDLASNPINGATVALGARTATTDATGSYSFTNLPAGTYPGILASFPGFNSSSASSLVVTEGGTTTQNFALSAAATSGCLTDTTQADFQGGIPNKCDLASSPDNVVLLGGAAVDQQSTTLGTSGVGITTTTFGGQTFTPSVSGKLAKVDINLFCSGCTGTTPNLTLSLRATTGGLPTGADLAAGTITGFSSGSAFYYTATFATQPVLTAGTQYALVIAPTSNPSPGTYALTRSGTSTAGADVYPGGTRVSGATGGTVWSIPLNGGVSTDAGFRVYIDTGFNSSGDFTSSTKDANPGGTSNPTWGTLTWTADIPANTSVKFQAAASNNVNGPFNFVGPDGTAGTFFATSGASLAQFSGNRYLKYKAYLSTADGAITPTLNDVTVCFSDLLPTTLQASAATGVQNGTADLSATLTAGGSGLLGKTINFSLNGTSVGNAVTDSNGVATLTAASLNGIAAGAYPNGVSANFAGDMSYASSSATAALKVRAIQTITFGALSDKTFGDPDFSVSATSDSGLTVTFGASGKCTITGTLVHITGAGTCTITASQAGDPDFGPAADVPQAFTIGKANQTITFAALPDKTFGAADFTVAATASSGLAVTFGATGNCTITNGTVHLTGGGTCTVTASQAGNGNYNAAADVPRTFNVADFNLGTATGGSTTASVAAGSPATYNLKASSVSGFTGTVNFTCAGAPDKANCTVNPASVNLSATTTSATYTVTVTTTATAGTQVAASNGSGSNQNLAWIVSFSGLGAFVLLGSKKRRVRIGGVLAILAFAMFLNGCGDDKKPPVPGTPKGAYTLTVSATSGGTTHTQQLTLNVQ